MATYQVTCPFHSALQVRCTKTATARFTDPEHLDEIIRDLKLWAVRAGEAADKQEHQGGRGLPRFSPAERSLTDSELDALEQNLILQD